MEEKPRRPGFFSRMFERKHDADTTAPEPTDIPAAEPPSEFPEDVAAEQKKRGMLSRLFGKKDAPQPVDAPPPAEVPPEVEEKNWFSRLTERIGKASQSLVGRMLGAIGLGARLDEDTLETIEEILVQSDVSFETTNRIVERLRRISKERKVEGRDAIIALVKEEIRTIVGRQGRTFMPPAGEGPYVVMVVGVNGAGKTTTIGKMAKRCSRMGMKVMIVAGDTFRAAATEQLEVWSRRAGAEFVGGSQGMDPSALAFDAMERALAHGVDVVFMDTAGRLHTKSNLMQELGKIERVIKKKIPAAPHETLIVLDATTGQNAVLQMREFSKAAPINGIVMTKLDGTAKGGVLVSIRDQFDVPITLIGVGEGEDDLRDFDPDRYVEALFAGAGG